MHLVPSLGGFYFDVAEHSRMTDSIELAYKTKTLTPVPPHSRDNLEPKMLSKWIRLIRLLDILVSLYGIEIFSFLLEERTYTLFKGLPKAAANTLVYTGIW